MKACDPARASFGPSAAHPADVRKGAGTQPRAGTDARPTVAVVGAGVSGLTAAYLLRHTHRVTLFETEHRLGGHARTHLVRTAGGDELPVDSGFVVHDAGAHPYLARLFDELGVVTRPTETSMSVSCDGCGLTYTGGRSVRGILAQPRRIDDPRFVRMLAEVPRLYRLAGELLYAGSDDGPTFGEFLAAGGFSEYFVRHLAVPLAACVWPMGDAAAGTYPARHLFAILDNHGMLTGDGSPQWRAVVGGSAAYVERIVDRLPDVRCGLPVTAVARHSDGIDLRTADGTIETFDLAVLAVRADQALELLRTDATARERADLAAIRYSSSRTWLHRDGSVLPSNRLAQAAWNYRMSCNRQPAAPALVSYWMNRLHGYERRHGYPQIEDLVVTVGPDARVDPASVIAETTYAHPVFTHRAVAAARRLRTAGGGRLAFAGAYLGWGRHEDGCRSGFAAAEALSPTARPVMLAQPAGMRSPAEPRQSAGLRQLVGT